MKPYSSYKPSGIPWLAPIPAHWETKRAKRLFHKMGRPPQHNDKVVTCFRDGAVTLRENRRTEGFTESLQEIGYQGIREGDLVVHNMDAFAGAIGVSDSDGKGTPVYSVCTMTPDANAHYYAATIREMARSQWVTALATGIRERSTDFRYATLAQQILPVPPPDEQAAIVRFLDHNDELINRYISAKERLIALLEEQRQAVIHQAVTRGLDSDVQTKPGEIPWLENIPKHWDVRRLGQLATKFGSGVTPRGGAAVYRDNGVPFLRSQNVHFDGLRLDDVVRIPLNLHESMSTSHVQPHDVLLNITGASIGRVCSVPHDLGQGNVNQHVCIIRPNQQRLLSRFLVAFLSTSGAQNDIRTEQTGASREGLTLQSIRDFRIPLPSISEQTQIVHRIDEATHDVYRAIASTSRQIDLTNEYRTRLIADVVTGQIDVHNAAVELHV